MRKSNRDLCYQQTDSAQIDVYLNLSSYTVLAVKNKMV